MAITEQTVSLGRRTLERIQRELRAQALDGWLLYDFRGLNPIAGGILGLPAMTRRWFVLIPATGDPVALTHGIEQQPWEGWIGSKRVYASWRSLDGELRALLAGRGRVALEYSPDDAVPYVDRVPAGVLELVRGAGAEVVSSADLVTAFYARWTDEGEAAHRRAGATLRAVAFAAFDRVRDELRAGRSPDEWSLRRWVQRELAARGAPIGADAIVAVNGNAANPHYAPSATENAPIAPGDLLLLDLWAKEDEEAVYADQTWMAFVGEELPARVQEAWAAVRDARLAAVDLIERRWRDGQPVAGYEVDDAARGVVVARGYGDHFIHRTGHSIDRELHGSGPNIDNYETRDTRLLVPGVGFSIEPGIYLAGELGFRSEINVFVSPGGPEVTTPEPQVELHRIVP